MNDNHIADERKPIYQVLEPCEASWADVDWLTYESTDGAFKRIVYAAPIAPRADADTAGAKYHDQEPDWENPAPMYPASERADAEKDAALNTLFEILMQQNIVTGAESYLSLRCVGVPPAQEAFVQAVKRAILAANKEKP